MKAKQAARAMVQTIIGDIGFFLEPRILGHTPFAAQLVNLCLEHEVVTPDEVRNWIRECVFSCGKACLRQLTYERPDHTIAPWALAYALDHGVIPDGEARKIRFDHGDTLETFRRQYPDDLIERLYARATHRAGATAARGAWPHSELL